MKRVDTPEDLTKELLRLGKLTKDKFGDVLSALSLKGYNELVERSATDTGFLRSNWDVVVGGALDAELENPYTPGRQVVWESPYPDPPIAAGDSVTLYNNTEYAMHLETGTATMEAQPMIQPTIVVLTVEATQLVNTLSKKRIG